MKDPLPFKDMSPLDPPSHRFESFGGIFSFTRPPALVYVDREYMSELGLEGGEAWLEEKSILSAPTEVHLNITHRCPAGCSHCYMDSTPASSSGDMEIGRFKSIIDSIAQMKVFHVAIGGGEPVLHPDIAEMFRYCRSMSIVPNMTTNGLYIPGFILDEPGLAGQVNVSMDGIGDSYMETRGHDGFSKADRSLRLLAKSGARAGINCVVSRKNFLALEKIVEYAESIGLGEVEFLRFKPAGRASGIYSGMKLTADENVSLFPKIMDICARHDIRVKLDCSFAPMICRHDPDPKLLDFFGIPGCDGGNALAGIGVDGRVSPCSFIREGSFDSLELPSAWTGGETFREFRTWEFTAPQPCASCEYLKICRGGCHAVSRFVTGGVLSPDPECPRVHEFNKR